MKQKQIIINGLLINYYAGGGGDQPLIFLHGWRSDASVWLPAFQALTPYSYALYALDLPGFGASELPKHPFTLHNYADIVKEFINHVPNPSPLKPIIIGHSFGARVAMRYAADNPEGIEKLVLIGSGGAPGKASGIKKIIAKITKPFFMPRFMQPLRRAIYAAIGADDYLATPHLQKTFLNIIKEDIMPIARTISIPALIIWGEHDAVSPLAYGKKLHETIHGSELAIISNAGHFCFLDQPEKCINAMRTFIKENEAPRAYACDI